MVDFKMMFIGYFNHKEFMVRKLSAQSLISFTAKESLLSTLKILRDLVLTNATLNNFVHGCLLAMSHGAKLMKNEYPAMYKSSLAELIEIVGSIDRKLVKLCSYNDLLLYDIEFVLGIQSQEFSVSNSAEAEEELYHPGVRDMLIKYGPASNNAEEGPKSLDGCKRFLATQLHRRGRPGNASLEEVTQMLEFLQENTIEKRQILTGPMVEECNKWIQKWGQEVILREPELAMDILQVVSNPIVGQKFGTSAANSCISTSALAITSMVLKDDYKMFFGDDTSTYVSIFCDLADAMVKMADPSSQEISRLHTGDALLYLVDIFNQRVLLDDGNKSELNIHMRYGLVQVMNAALVLLEDENCDVRMKAVAFVSRLCCHRQDQDDDGAAKLLVCARIPRTVILEKIKAGSYQIVMCCGSSKFSHFKQKN